jgi:hypothetical protein
MHEKDDLPPIWKPEPIKLVVVEQAVPDEDEEREEFLAAIRAAKEDSTEILTTEDLTGHTERE